MPLALPSSYRLFCELERPTMSSPLGMLPPRLMFSDSPPSFQLDSSGALVTCLILKPEGSGGRIELF